MSVSIGRQSRLARRGVDALAHVHLDGRVILVGVFLARESMDAQAIAVTKAAIPIRIIKVPIFIITSIPSNGKPMKMRRLCM